MVGKINKSRHSNSKFDIELSIVTPCYNEEATIRTCIERVAAIMSKSLPGVIYEHIITDNNSRDATVSIVREICHLNPRVKLVVSNRNVGPFKNMYRGLEKAIGRAIVPMLAADLQDPPELIPQMYKLWLQSSKTIFGQRLTREENFFLRLSRRVYYRAIQLMSGGDYPVGVGEFMVVDQRIIRSILETKDYYPYIRGMVALSSPDYLIIPYNWKRRRGGRSSNNFFRLFDQAINGLISTSRIPARISLIIGFVIASLSLLYALFSLLYIVIARENLVAGIPTLIVTLTFLGGLILFFLGVIGEYVLAIHSQVRKLPEAFDIELVNFDTYNRSKIRDK